MQLSMKTNFARKALSLCFIHGALGTVNLLAPINAQAAEPRNVACSVTVDYLLNDVVRAPYQRDFVIAPGVGFQDDFSTATRFRYLDASTRLEADGKTTTISFSYYNDVGVFEAIDFRTELKVRDDRVPQTTSGSHTYWSSLGEADNHTTDYTITCIVLKN